MFRSVNRAMRAYSESGAAAAMAASPHQLVTMLFEAASIAVSAARVHMQSNRPAQKAESLSKAISIIDDGLRASLDLKAGGDMAEKLASLYDYMVLQLMHANTGNRPEALDEVGRLLSELAGVWGEIGRKSGNTVTAAER